MPCTTEYFYKNQKNSKDGLYPECKRCAIKRTQINRQENFEYRKQYDKKRYRSNPNKFKENDKKVQRAKPEHYKHKNKLWRKRNHDKCREYGKKRSFKKHEIVQVEWDACKKYFNNCCAYCGLHKDHHFMERGNKIEKHDLHKEHVIDNGKNDLRNCVPSCYSCNSQKNKKTLNEFYNPENPNYTYEQYYKIYQWIRYDYKNHILPKRRYKGQHISMRIKEIEQSKNK